MKNIDAREEKLTKKLLSMTWIAQGKSFPFWLRTLERCSPFNSILSLISVQFLLQNVQVKLSWHTDHILLVRAMWQNFFLWLQAHFLLFCRWMTDAIQWPWLNVQIALNIRGSICQFHHWSSKMCPSTVSRKIITEMLITYFYYPQA